MRLRTLHLEQFRSFRSAELTVEPEGFLLIGPNASGKSSILEAVSMLATTRSPRTSSEREIANWQSGQDLGLPAYARLWAEFERADGNHSIEIGLVLEGGGTSGLKKRIRFDERPARAIDAVGQLNTVLFSPEDVGLISGAPAGRRRFLDVAISQASRVYLRALSRFGRVLEQRNGLLRTLARERFTPQSRRPEQELAFWNDELTTSAAEVLAFRLLALDALAGRARLHFAALAGEDSLTLVYQATRLDPPQLPKQVDRWTEPPVTYRQELAAAFAEAVHLAAPDELRRGVTAVGPHRDDFAILAGGVDLGRFGSRGQQRLAVLALKLAELDLLHAAAGEPPILLLDDALSELDAPHRAKLQSLLAVHDAQLLMSSTDDIDVNGSESWRLPILRMQSEALVRADSF